MINVKVVEIDKVFFGDMKILGLFVNTLTADDKYSLVNRETLTQHIQME